MKTGLFREELPGEKKSIINLLLTGYLVVISILGYFAFYLSIQLKQMERVLEAVKPETLNADQINVLVERLLLSTGRMHDEIIWLAILGSIFTIIGGIYTYNMVVRPLRKLVAYAEKEKNELPEIKTNNEIKQLMTVMTERMPFNGDTSVTPKTTPPKN